MKYRVHINQHLIRRNKSLITAGLENELGPVITVKGGGENRYANRVKILGAAGEVLAEVVYSPLKPLPCGAVCWVEINNQDVELE